jgi:hypothetical protein
VLATWAEQETDTPGARPSGRTSLVAEGRRAGEPACPSAGDLGKENGQLVRGRRLLRKAVDFCSRTLPSSTKKRRIEVGQQRRSAELRGAQPTGQGQVRCSRLGTDVLGSSSSRLRIRRRSARSCMRLCTGCCCCLLLEEEGRNGCSRQYQQYQATVRRSKREATDLVVGCPGGRVVWRWRRWRRHDLKSFLSGSSKEGVGVGEERQASWLEGRGRKGTVDASNSSRTQPAQQTHFTRETTRPVKLAGESESCRAYVGAGEKVIEKEYRRLQRRGRD